MGSRATEVDFYALLNVSRTASAAEITAAYRKLSRIYHPDRVQQRSPELATAAKEKFQLLSEAHAVLTDEHLRQLYNTHGIEGVRAGRQLANRSKSPEEFRRELEKLRRGPNEAAWLDLLQSSHGTVTVGLSVAHVVQAMVNAVQQQRRRRSRQQEEQPQQQDEPYQRRRKPQLLHLWPRLTNISASHYFEMPLWARTVGFFRGTAHSGMGGELHCGLVHQLQPGTTASLEVATTGETTVLKVASSRQLGRHTRATLGLILQPQSALRQLLRGGQQQQQRPSSSSSMLMVPAWLLRGSEEEWSSSLELAMHRQLSHTVNASWMYTVGQQGGMCLRLSRIADDDPAKLVVAEVHQDGEQLSVAVKLERPVDKKTTFKVGARLGTQHSSCMVGAKWRPSKKSPNTFGMFLDCSSQRISYKFTFERGTQKVSVPLLLTPHVTPAGLCLAAMVPAVLFVFAKLLYFDPQNRLKKQRKLYERRRANRDSVARAKQSADDDLSIFLKGIDLHVKMEVEEARRGLIVLEAKYGPPADILVDLGRQPPPSDAPDPLDAVRIADLTTALQLLVDDSKLLLDLSTLLHHTGMWDPAPGEKKTLFVRYLFKDRVHETFSNEDDQLSIPQKAHLAVATPNSS